MTIPDSITQLNNVITLPLSDVVYREDLYPRIKSDAATIQRYADNLDVLPPIELNQHGILIDGYHRWTAHKTAKAATIRAFVTETASEVELYALAIERNSAHGLQMNDADKRTVAIRLYASGTGLDKQQIAHVLSVSPRSVNSYLSDIDKQLREERKQRIFDMWLSGDTASEIAEAVGVHLDTVSEQVSRISEALPKSEKVLSQFQDEDFTAPLFNVTEISREEAWRRLNMLDMLEGAS